jgi:tellurite resistance-related uncharacterized protein
MKPISARGATGHLISVQGKTMFRVYDQDHNFTDYDIHHADLEVTITDPDAFFYCDKFTDRLDHGPDTLGLD